MASLGSLLIAIGVDLTAFNAAMADMNTRLKKAESDSAGAWSGFEAMAGRMTNVGQTLSLAVTAPLVGIAAASAQAFGSFEQSLNRVSALGEIAGADLEKLKAQAIDLGAKTQFSAKQAADGMAELAAAGFTATQTMEAMPAVLNLAAAGQLSVAQASETAANVMGGFGIKATEVGHAVDVMAKAAASGSLSVNDLAYTFKYVGPVATAAGISLEEVAAATTLLSNAGIKGEQSGTSLRGAIASLLDPSKEAATVLNRLGVETQTADRKLRPFSAIVGELGKAGATTKDIFSIFGRETASAMQALVTAGEPALKKLTAELVNSDGAAQRMAGTINSGYAGAMERLKGSVETAGIALGESLAPSIITVAGLIESGANKIAEFAKWFNDLPEPVKTTAIAVTGLVAAIGPLLLIAGQMATAIISIQGALALATPALTGFVSTVGASVAAFAPWVVAIGAATVAVYKLWEAFEGWKNAKKALEDAETRGADALNKLENHLRDNGYAVDALKKEYQDGRLSLTEYQKELRRLGVELGNKKKSTDQATASTTKATKAQNDIEKALTAVRRASQQATTAHETHARSITGVATQSESLTKKSEVLVSMERILEQERQKAIESVARYRLGMGELANATPKLTEINYELSASIKDVGSSMGIVEQLSEDFQRSLSIALEAPAPIATRSADRIIEEFSRIPVSVDGVVTESKGIWDRFGTDLTGSLGRATTIWDDWGGDISRSAGDLGRSISESLWSGDSSFGKMGVETLRDIGEAFTTHFFDVVTRGAKDLMSGVITDLLGGKGFGGLIDRIKDLGSSLAGIFGGGGNIGNIGGSIGGAAGSTGGAAGSVGGAGGSVGSVAGGAGAAAITGAIGGVVGAISGVISNFQNAKQETSLNAIEHNTRYSMMYLGERADGGILGRLYDVADTLKYGTLVQATESIRNYIWDYVPGMYDALADLSTRMDFAVRRLDQIGNDAMYGSHADREQIGLLAEIREAVRSGPKANITINVSGAASPQATSDAIASQLRTQFAF